MPCKASHVPVDQVHIKVTNASSSVSHVALQQEKQCATTYSGVNVQEHQLPCAQADPLAPGSAALRITNCQTTIWTTFGTNQKHQSTHEDNRMHRVQ